MGRPLIRSMDLSRPQPSASNTPKELADPDRFFTVLWSVWSNTRSSQWRQIDEGERQLVLEATAIKGSDPCYCNETPGALFQDCCRKKSSFAVVVQTPGSAGFRPMGAPLSPLLCAERAAQRLSRLRGTCATWMQC